MNMPLDLSCRSLKPPNVLQLESMEKTLVGNGSHFSLVKSLTWLATEEVPKRRMSDPDYIITTSTGHLSFLNNILFLQLSLGSNIARR